MLFVNSQTTEFKAKVMDENHYALQYALINIHNYKNSYNDVTDSLGNFTIKLNDGKYKLEINYNDKVVYQDSIIVNRNNSFYNFITNYSENTLKAITITGNKKRLIDRKGDRLIFNVSQSLSSTGKNALDILKITPGVQIRNGQIGLIGKSSVSVMINDEILSFSEEDLNEYLTSIPSDALLNIEVITNPSAKYDAEGNSGLINIVLKDRSKNGLDGTIGASYIQSKYATGNYNASISYKNKKLSINSNLNYLNGSNSPFQEYLLNYSDFIWYEKNSNRIFQNNFTSFINSNYNVSDRLKINFNYAINLSKSKKNGINTSIINNRYLSKIDSTIITPYHLSKNKTLQTFGISLNNKIDSLGKNLYIDFNYSNFNSSINNNSISNSFNEFQDLTNESHFTNSSNQDINIFTSKIDYEFPLKWFAMSIGTKTSFISTKSNSKYLNIRKNEMYTTDNNYFKYNENTQAFYVTILKDFSEKFNIQTGLRVETTQTKGFSEQLNHRMKKSYVKFFPSAHLTYKFNDDQILSFNFNNRIDRPTYSDLNPFKFYSTFYSYTEGNPFLQAYNTKNYELSFIYKNWYSSLYYSKIKNGIDQITLVNNSDINQRTTPYNFYKQNSLGLIQNYTLNLWKWWECNSTGIISYTNTLNSILKEAYIPNIYHWSWSMNSMNNFLLNSKETLKAELNVQMNSRSIANSYILSSYYQIDLGLRLSLFEKKLNISISADDIFKTNKSTFYQTVNNIHQKNYDYSDSRKIRFTLIYKLEKYHKNNDIENTDFERSDVDEKNRIK